MPNSKLTTMSVDAHNKEEQSHPLGGGVGRTGRRMSQKVTSDILKRLKSAEGHVGGIARMVESDVYCIDIVNQIVAVQRALEKVNTLVLDRHLHTCATTAIRGDNPDERERVIGEILDVFKSTAKR